MQNSGFPALEVLSIFLCILCLFFFRKFSKECSIKNHRVFLLMFLTIKLDLQRPAEGKITKSECAYSESIVLDTPKLWFLIKAAQTWDIQAFICTRQNDGLSRLTFQLTHLASRHRWMGKMTLTHIRPTFLCKDRSMIIRKWWLLVTENALLWKPGKSAYERKWLDYGEWENTNRSFLLSKLLWFIRERV